MTRLSSLIVLCLFINTSIIAQNCDGVLDTIQICNFEYTLNLLSSEGDLEVTCPDVDAHIAIDQEALVLQTTVNECGEYIITHTYTNLILNCEIEDVYVLQFDDPSNQEINISADLEVAYGPTGTHEGGEADCENPTEITIAGVPVPIIEWTDCYDWMSQVNNFSAEVIIPNPALMCEVDSIAINVSGDASSISACSGFTQDDFYMVAGVDFWDFVGLTGSNDLSDWFTSVLDIPISDCDFDDNQNDNEIDTLIQENTYYIPVRTGGNWAIIQNGSPELLEDTTNITLQSDPDYIFIIDPAADYIGPGDITFELLYWNGVDTVQTPNNQNLTLQWIEFWDYDTLTVIDTFYQTNEFVCGGLFINQSGYIIPDAPASPFGPIDLFFPNECDCVEMEAYADWGEITCYEDVAFIEAFGSSSDGDVVVEFFLTGDQYLITSNPGSYEFSVTSVTSGCVIYGSAYVDYYIDEPIANIIGGGTLDCTNPCTDIEVATSNFVDIEWSNGENSSSITVCQGGTYSVIVTDVFNGCSTYESITIQENFEIPTIEIVGETIIGCETPCVQLTGIIGNNIKPSCVWMDQNGQEVGFGTTVEICEPGTYTVEVIDFQNGCTNTASVTIVEDEEIPNLVIATPNVITCDESCVTIEAMTDAPENCYWIDENGNIIGEATTSIEVCSPGIYTVEVAGENGCTNTASVEVLENTTPPEVFIEGETVLNCENPCVVLTGIIPDNIPPNCIWFGPDGQIIGELATVEVCEPGTYTVEVFDPENGCFNSASVTITEDFEIPILIIDPPNTITCDEPCVTLTASTDAPLNCVWTNKQQGGVIGEGASIEVCESGVYAVEVTGENGCTNFEVVEVVENTQLPEVSIEGETLLTCENPCVELTGIIGINVEPVCVWMDPNGNPIGEGITIEVCEPGTYTVEVVNFENGCTNNASITIEADADIPTVEILPVDMITCDQTCVTITAETDAPLNCEWTNEQGDILQGLNSIEVCTPGEYTVEVTGENGCTNSASVVVLEDTELPEVTIVGETELTCDNPYVELTGVTDVEPSCLWFGPNGQVFEGLGIEVCEAGVYTMEVINFENGCTNSTSITITENFETPIVSIDPPEEITCEQPCVTLMPNINSNNSTTIEWLDENNNSLGTEISLEVCEAGTYTVIVTDTNNGCTASEMITVTESLSASSIEIVGELVYCEGGNTTLTASPGFTSYLWETGETTSSITIGNGYNGACTVTAIDENGCLAEATVMVEEIQPPEFSITGVTSICEGESTTLQSVLNMGNIGDVEFIWLNSNGEIISSGSSLTISNTGCFSVEAYNEFGCWSEQEICIEISDNLEVSILGESQICANGTTMLSLNNSFDAYQWSNDATDSNIEVEAGTYSVTVSNSNGCTGETSMTISEMPEPIAMLIGETTFCEGSSSMVSIMNQTGTPFENYQWSDGTTASTLEINEAGTYCVTAIDANGCETELCFDAFVNEIAPPSIIGETVFCEGESTTLLAPDAYANYAWSNSSEEVSTEVSSAGTYELTVTDFNGCTAISSIEITESILPEVQLDPIQVIDCNNTFVTINANSNDPNLTIEWVGSNGFTSIGSSITIDFGVTLYCIATNQFGCVVEEIIEVTEDINTPSISLESTVITCEETAAMITSTTFDNNLTYDWTGPNGFTSNEINPIVTSSGDYEVVVTGANGCSTSQSISVTENTDTPTLALELSNALSCDQNTAMLNATTDATTIQWWLEGTLISSTTDPLEITESGEYTVIAYSNNGCEQTEIITVQSTMEMPIIEAEAELLDCCSPSATVTGNSDMDDAIFEWTGPNSFTATGEIMEATIPGEYTLIVTAANGCSATTSVIVEEVTSLAPLNEYVNGTITCAESSIEIGAFEIENATYEWIGPASFISNEINPVVSEAGTYTLTVTNEYCCQSIVSVEVSAELDLPDVFVPNYSLTCQNTEVLLTPESSVINLSYAWTNDTGFESIEVNPIITEGGNYELIITDLDNGCTNIANFIVEEVDMITASFSTQESCENLAEGSIDLQDVSGGVPPYAINWEEVQSTDFSIENLTAGSYNFEITDDGDCIENGTLVVEAMPVTVYSESEKMEICNGDEIMLNPSIDYPLSVNAQFEWQDGTTTPELMINEIGEYSVQISQFCEVYEHIYEIDYSEDMSSNIFIPNAFSPNNDGINDYFLPVTGADLIEYDLYVFDRWGELLYQTSNPAEGWDGQRKNRALKPSVFIYQLNAKILDCKGEVVDVRKYGDFTLVK